MTNKGRLFLIPNLIAENTLSKVLTPEIQTTLATLRYFLVEDVRNARRYLSSLRIYDSIESLNFFILNKDTPEVEMPELLNPILSGHDMGIISESGCPGIADPGAMAVKLAHHLNIQVVPMVGPSSIILSLMASGLNGQNFAFHGYLPIESKEAAAAIKAFERESKTKKQTQLFIETPYRNNAIMKNLLASLHGETALCIAMDVTGKDEFIATKLVHQWRLQTIELPKKPAVFLFLA